MPPELSELVERDKGVPCRDPLGPLEERQLEPEHDVDTVIHSTHSMLSATISKVFRAVVSVIAVRAWWWFVASRPSSDNADEISFDCVSFFSHNSTIQRR